MALKMKFKLNNKTLIKLNLFLLVTFSIIFCFSLKGEKAKAGIEVSQAAADLENKEIDPEDLYNKVWELIKKDYVDQTYNNQDWNIWKDRYKGKLKNLDDSHKAIETMLASLGDRYTRFLNKRDFEDEKQAINA